MEGNAPIFENPFRGKPSVQKQSYIPGDAGGARVILASYGESTIRLRDDASVTHALTDQVRDLNDFLRRSGGGAGAIRASLGGTAGGYGGRGYGGGQRRVQGLAALVLAALALAGLPRFPACPACIPAILAWRA